VTYATGFVQSLSDSNQQENALAGKCSRVHRGRIEFVLDALEMIEPLDCAVEFRAFLFRKPGFHSGNGFGELGSIQILRRGSHVRE
jgi:hypothetical protein